jgi:FKBP-type peptidyl-prolyl cis-trans isomerase SlyD
VEEALLGQSEGFEAALHLEPEHAFGDYDANLVFFEARDVFTGHIEPGMQFDGPPEGVTTAGLPADAIYTVTEVYDSHVVLDGNHPLAGIALNLALKVRAVREATEEEVEAGSVAEPTFTVLNTVPTSQNLH